LLTHKYANLLTNDEWDLVNCRHGEAHNEPEKRPWPEIWSSCREQVSSYQGCQTCKERWAASKPDQV